MNPASQSPAPTPHLLCAEGIRPGLWQSCDLWRVSVSEPADGLTPAPFAIQCVIWSTHVVIPAAASSGVTGEGEGHQARSKTMWVWAHHPISFSLMILASHWAFPSLSLLHL